MFIQTSKRSGLKQSVVKYFAGLFVTVNQVMIIFEMI